MAAIVISSDSVQPTDSTEFEVVTAGESIIAGKAVYLDSSDAGTAKRAGADVTQNANVVGISMCVSADGQPLVIATGGEVNIGGTVVPGVPYFLGGSLGTLVPEGDVLQDWKMTRIGIATTTTNILIDIDPSDTQLA